MPLQFFRQPRYYNSFSCIGGSCPTNCCISWRVDWEKDDVEKLKNADCSEHLRSLIDSSFMEFGGKYIIKMGEMDEMNEMSAKNKCPFLTEDNFCSIQRELGEEYLSNICRTHPRKGILSGNVILNCCHTSCCHVVDTLCSDSECMILENFWHKEKKNIQVYIYSQKDFLNHPELKYRRDFFEFFYEVISDDSYSVETAVTLGAVAAQSISRLVENKAYDKIPDNISALKKQLKNPAQIKKLEELKPNYAVKLGFAKKLNDIILKTNMIDLISENGTIIADKYDEGMSKFNEAFAERPFALRNIALNLLLDLEIPFRSLGHSIFENYCYYAAAFAVTKLTAAASFINNNNSQTAVTPAVTVSGNGAQAVRNLKNKTKTDHEREFKIRLAYINRRFAHNNDNVPIIIDMYKELNCMSPAYIALIVK